ncbi:MAG: tripartite tricarboxylate transporter family receptor [Hyphomicrobiales bacterium]|nr:tripartite tricarboxylate transporter family receptor [Hyphomicrobiales bacterium]
MKALGAIISLAAALASSGASRAQAPDDFYKGKTLTIITSTGAGGPYDLVARILSKHMAKNLPGNPTTVIQNMPGGGHVLATNYIYNQAAKDGTAIATVANSIPMHQLIDGKGVRYDARRINWLGSTGISNLVTVAWRASGVTTTDDVLKRELIVGATGTGSGTYLYPAVMNAVLGTKFKLVMGYKATTEIDLAMERGEVAGRSGGSIAGMMQEHPGWFTDKKVVVLSQVGAARDPLAPDAPLMEELGRTPDERAILRLVSSPVALGRPFLTGPEVPRERVELLRRAFDAAMKDPGFLSEAEKAQLDINPLTGEQVTKIVLDSFTTPPELVDRIRAIVAQQ